MLYLFACQQRHLLSADKLCKQFWSSRQKVGPDPDLDPICLTLWNFFEKNNFEKNQRQQKYHDKLPMMQRDELDLQAKKGLRWFAYNTGTDQPAHWRRLIRAFVFRWLESIISKLASGEISKFLANLSSPYLIRVKHCEIRVVYLFAYQKWHFFFGW